LLAELDRQAPTLLGEGRPLRVADDARHLGDASFRGHPWAKLLVGCALSDADPADGRGRRYATAALASFRRRGDRRGEAYACFVLGCRALEAGDITRAARWWRKARGAGDAEASGLEIMLAHLGLAEYARGQLAGALAVTEEAVAIARLHRRPRAEATALVNVAFVHLWTGEFPRALDVLAAAEDAFDQVVDAFDRYELPLCVAARATVHALRGDLGAAEAEFGRALGVAQQVNASWYEAIVLALRAELTAEVDTRRARRDADIALRILTERGDTWWSVWARQATGVVAAEAGLHDAAEVIFRQLLREEPPVLERARTGLLLGEALLRAGRPGDAAPLLAEAAARFEVAGARYWEARCCTRLVQAQPDRAREWASRVGALASDDPAYRRLLGRFQLMAQGPGQVLVAGEPVALHTHGSERALFLLAFAGDDGLHAEALADQLWPHSGTDHRHLLNRLRTLLWDMRRGLGLHASRLERRHTVIRLDMNDAELDVAALRTRARSLLADPAGAGPDEVADAVEELRRPLLTRWSYEDWVVDENRRNADLAHRLTRSIR
jgi:tetratricopeptide (TPR) repeat protein